ncbi:nucleolin-like isoform X2 [Eleutherodactylus coqui]|uniref:nucleolin-like isoform X2 n=1 Tax=Eleutherodactylus coqui TaxID=57060 RepID=UPI00346377F2
MVKSAKVEVPVQKLHKKTAPPAKTTVPSKTAPPAGAKKETVKESGKRKKETAINVAAAEKPKREGAEETVKKSRKHKKEMPINVAAPKRKKQKREGAAEKAARTLFVKNLPNSAGVKERLQEIFGNAKDIRLPVGKGIAYVDFSTEAEADAALVDKQGTEIEGRFIFIDYTGEKSQFSGCRRGLVGDDCKVLAVRNLAVSATEDRLQEVFEKAISIKISQNKQGKPMGYAFVEFSSAEEAKEALESYNATEIAGRSILIEFSQGVDSQGGKGSTPLKTLYVRGLSEDTTEETLREAFGGSVSARIVTDKDTGASLGFGFVEFSTAEDAKAAKEAMEDGEIDGNKVTLDFAKPKGEDGRRGGPCISRTGGPL